MTQVSFTKMHGLGNDVVIINALDNKVELKQLPIQELANRHIGVGFDQLLILEPGKDADFFCRIFNADGSEAEQCGNGLRCLARYIHEEKLHNEKSFSIQTKSGIYPLIIKNYEQISVSMGAPEIKENLLELKMKSDSLPVSVLSVGNPHAIMKVASVDTVLTDQLGAEISTHQYFSNGANVGFMQIVNADHIRLRTFERGVGETNACGSNACAAVVAGIANEWLTSPVKVEFKYGSLEIEWAGEGEPVKMTGPAVRIFSGEI